MSATRLRDKISQPVFFNEEFILSNVTNVYAHSEGHFTGIIAIKGNKARVICLKKIWRLRE